MAYRLLRAADAHWRPSNQMKVENTDLAKQLDARTMGARLWRLRPGQASTKHRHRDTAELYVLLEGTGRLRVDDEVLTLGRLDHGIRRARAHAPGVQRHRGRRAVADRGSARTPGRQRELWRRNSPCASSTKVFNDTDDDALWLIMGAPNEAANTLEMSEETIAFLYPDGPKALPPELS